MSELIRIGKKRRHAESHAIFFHGLGGHPFDTWSAMPSQDRSMLHWLGADFDHLDVWTVGYEAAISRFRGHSMHLADRALNILEALVREDKLKRGQIYLVGHSLGGLVIKQLLRTADVLALARPDVARFLLQVTRVVFLGTPHGGAQLATLADWFRVVVWPSEATASLVRNDPVLRELNNWYRDWARARPIDHLVLIEAKSSGLAGMIVKPDSADPGLPVRAIPMDATHATLCKPSDRRSEVYRLIGDFLGQKQLSVQDERSLPFIPSVPRDQREIRPSATDTATVVAAMTEALAAVAALPVHLIDAAIDLELDRLRRTRFFIGVDVKRVVRPFAQRLVSGELRLGTASNRCVALAWCARFLAYEESAEADDLIGLAKSLGDCPEVTIARTFRIAAKGDVPAALQNLTPVDSPSKRTAALMVIFHVQGFLAAIEWIKSSCIDAADLDADGKVFLIQIAIASADWETAERVLQRAQPSDYDEAPQLRLIGGIVHLLQAIPSALKTAALQHVPISSKDFPLAADEGGLLARREASQYLKTGAIAARQLGASEAAIRAEEYALWLDLRDVDAREDAIARLQASLRDSSSSLRYVPLALEFGVALDRDAIEREIDRQEALTAGASTDAALARFALATHNLNPKASAAYFEKHLQQIQRALDPNTVAMIRIEILSQAGLIEQAQEVLSEIQDKVPSTEFERLAQLLTRDRAESLTGLESQFRASNQLGDLLRLVSELESQRDWKRLTNYAQELFARTRTVENAETLLRSLEGEARLSAIDQFIEANELLSGQSALVARHNCWRLFRAGKLKDAWGALSALPSRWAGEDDPLLRSQILVALGDWEQLLGLIEAQWNLRSSLSARQRLSFASLAQQAGSPRARDFAFAAVEVSPSDPEVLTGAYSVATRGGWEGDASVAEWLKTAIFFSGEQGPIRPVTIKELVTGAPAFQRRQADAWAQFREAKIPLFVYGKLVNQSPSELSLAAGIANRKRNDVRERAIIPAFSGSRTAVEVASKMRAAIDITSLLTLAALDLLAGLKDVFRQLVIPHATTSWIFSERGNLTFHQPSRIKDANEVRSLIATDRLKPVEREKTPSPAVVEEVGIELAALLETAHARSQAGESVYVVKPAPIHRANSLMEEFADVSRFSAQLRSCLAVVSKLRQKGQLTAEEESHARAYLQLHDVGATGDQEIADGAALLLDSVGLAYFQHLGILGRIAQAGITVEVPLVELARTNSFLELEAVSAEALSIIDRLRKYLQREIDSGFVELASVVYEIDEDASDFMSHPSAALIHSAPVVDAVVADDRFWNQHGNVEAPTGGLRPVLTTLDLLEAWVKSEFISAEKSYQSLTRLRQAGFAFVSVSEEEVTAYLSSAAVANGDIVESAELRAIRENVLLCRMRGVLNLPRESAWLAAFFQVGIAAIKSQWASGDDSGLVEARCSWLAKLLDARGWFGSANSGSVVPAIYGAHYMPLLIAPSGLERERRMQYWAWVEGSILSSLEERDPDLRSWLVDRAKEIVSDALSSRMKEGG